MYLYVNCYVNRIKLKLGGDGVQGPGSGLCYNLQYLAHVDLVDGGVGGGGGDASPGRHCAWGPHVPDQLPPPETLDQSEPGI